jgi:hypothetical protein
MVYVEEYTILINNRSDFDSLYTAKDSSIINNSLIKGSNCTISGYKCLMYTYFPTGIKNSTSEDLAGLLIKHNEDVIDVTTQRELTGSNTAYFWSGIEFY